MWETQSTITYDDYNLEDTSVLEQEVSNLMANLTPDCLSQMEGTTPQNKDFKIWYGWAVVRRALPGKTGVSTLYLRANFKH